MWRWAPGLWFTTPAHILEEFTQWLTQTSDTGNVREGPHRVRSRRCHNSGQSRSSIPSFTRPDNEGQRHTSQPEQNKPLTTESQHGFSSFHTQYCDAIHKTDITHWSVKCIYATPNKQDNVDSELEAVLNMYLGYDFWPCVAYLTIAEFLSLT